MNIEAEGLGRPAVMTQNFKFNKENDQFSYDWEQDSQNSISQNEDEKSIPIRKGNIRFWVILGYR